jgi:AraC-like DNA-binding protein
MAPPRPDAFAPFRFTTSDVPARDRLEMFRESFGRTILRIDMEPLPGTALEVDMTLRALPGIGMASGRLSPMRNRHISGLADNDDLVLVVMQGGIGEARQCEREAMVRQGEAILTANGEPGTFTGQSPTQVLNLRLSRAVLAPQLDDLGAALVRPIPRESPALRLLLSYASSLSDESAPTLPKLQHIAATHLHDLAAIAIGATRDATELARGRGVRAARLRAIRSDIARNLGQRDLSIGSIAARHRISERYVRSLLESEGTSFSELVLAQRLARAHRMLCNPLLAERTISQIAFECGFGDLSYFNRTFRRRYGATPSDVRAATRDRAE